MTQADDRNHAMQHLDSPRRSRGAGTLALYYFTTFAALGAYQPFLPPWLEARGLRGVEMGAVAAAIPAMGIVGPPMFGLAADALRIRRGILRLAGAGAFVSFGAVTAVATLSATPGFGAMLVAMLAFAVFRSPVIMMADVIALEHAKATPTSYGRIRLWGSVGFLVAATAVGRWVDPTAKFSLPIAILVGLASAVVATFLLAPQPGVDPTASLAAPAMSGLRALAGPRSADVRLFLVASFLGQIAHSSYDLCFSLRLRDLAYPPHLVGITWAVGVLAEIALMAGSGRLLARFPPRSLLVVAFAVAALRWALIASVRSYPLLFALQLLHAFSFALMWVASQGYLRERFAPTALGTVQGAFFAAMAAGSVVGMLVWGATYASYGGVVVFGAAAVVGVIASAVALVFARRPRIER